MEESEHFTHHTAGPWWYHYYQYSFDIVCIYKKYQTTDQQNPTTPNAWYPWLDI